MREALFIKRNAEKWNRYQNEPGTDPDEQAERFITLLDDLAYSRTFYPQSKVTQWINSIAAGIYQRIYQNKKENYSRIRTFWTTELPLVIHKHHRTLLFTFLFLAICIAMGAWSSGHDDSFVKMILGEEYVAMTEENISNGDPFGVYRDTDKFSMFVRIALNNIKVSFMAFAYGIFFGIGTLWVLFHNGIMIGAFEHIFFAKGLGWQSLLVIWIHGTIEISAIVIAGCAGLIVGASILFPGTYSRMQSFKVGIKDALKIILCLVPFFITAAILESYVTWQMSETFSKGGSGGMPVPVAISILVGSALLIGWYFVVYPIQVQRKQKHHTPLASFTPVTLQAPEHV
jgi:uncharacterized membrane protein SpoIIM required for sporulation